MFRDPELFHFIRERIASVWALELLLMMRGEPDRWWTVAGLAAEMRANETLVESAMAGLEAAELIERDAAGGRRFAPADARTAELCGRLAMAFKERPVTVIKTIAMPPDKVKGLADAFRFKGGST
ncbi:MAG: hypothetical protein ABW063_05970 [Caulobacter sp.]